MGFFTSIISWIVSSVTSLLTSLNIYMSIPVFTQIILSFILTNLSLTQELTYKLLIGLLSFLFSNVLHLIMESECTSDNTSIFGVLIKSSLNSFTQYGCAFLIPKILKFIPILGMIIRILTRLPFFMGDLVEFLLWILGYGVGYWITNHSKDPERCQGKFSSWNKYIGIGFMIYVIFKELVGSVF